MSSASFKLLLAALAGAATTAAHGHVVDVVINGVSYQGYDPTSFPYMQDPPTVVGWTTSQTDNGFVAPDAFGDGDIICHKTASNAGGHAPIAAGDSIFIQWNTWPESHKGPVIDYLAKCDGSCETADKTSLEFFKIDGVGLVDGSSAPGTWGSDQLVANNNSWLVQIPSNIAAGNYVLRHEIIALHSAGQEGGAQAYPQCVNLQVTSGGSDNRAGVKGTELYTASDPGILINIYQSLSSYEIPGPEPIDGATNVDQATSAITSSASAVAGSATGPAGMAPTTTADSGSGSGSNPTTSVQGHGTPTTASISSALVPVALSAPVPSSTPTGEVTCPGATKLRRHARDVQPL